MAFAAAFAAASELRPLNAPGSGSRNLPPPVYCPGLAQAIDATLDEVQEARLL